MLLVSIACVVRAVPTRLVGVGDPGEVIRCACILRERWDGVTGDKDPMATVVAGGVMEHVRCGVVADADSGLLVPLAGVDRTCARTAASIGDADMGISRCCPRTYCSPDLGWSGPRPWSPLCRYLSSYFSSRHPSTLRQRQCRTCRGPLRCSPGAWCSPARRVGRHACRYLWLWCWSLCRRRWHERRSHAAHYRYRKIPRR